MPGPDDDCPICYDSMGCEDEKTLVFCEPCGNALHQGCLAKCEYLLSLLAVHLQLVCREGNCTVERAGSDLCVLSCKLAYAFKRIFFKSRYWLAIVRRVSQPWCCRWIESEER